MQNDDPQISKPLNPVEVEDIIFNISNRIAKGVSIVSKREDTYMAAKRAYDRAVAVAVLEADGTVLEKKAKVELAVVEERDAMDLAYSAWKFADRQARALSLQLDAVRSIGASIRNMYQVAGRGEGA